MAQIDVGTTSQSSYAIAPSWTHGEAGTPDAILVLIVHATGVVDKVSGVTYGGVAMTELSGSPYIHNHSFGSVMYAYLLTDNIPSGNQTVAVSNIDWSAQAVAISLTADGEIVQTGTSAGDGGTGRLTATANMSAGTGIPTRTFGIGFSEAFDGGNGFSISSGYDTYYNADWGSNGPKWFGASAMDPDGGTITATVSQGSTNVLDITIWGLRVAPRAHASLAGPAVLGNTAATVLDASRDVLVETIHVSNPSGSPVDLTLSVGADAAGTRMFDGLSIPADTVKSFAQRLVLSDGEIIQAYAGTAGVLVMSIEGENL
jgi:hypothetical protein